jgi:hypothetical protein
MKERRIVIENNSFEKVAEDASVERFPRKKNWRYPQPTACEAMKGLIREDAFQYKGGRFKGYKGSYFVPLYTSYLHVLNKFQAEYICGFEGEITRRKLKAPKGTEWDIDGSLVVSSNFNLEYHPTLEDLLSKNFAERVRDGMKDAKSKRVKDLGLQQEQLKTEQTYINQVSSTLVNLCDSRRSGNCIEGTLRYAERKLKIDRRDILAAPWLINVPASKLDSTQECQRAIRQAWLRETTVAI